MPTEQDKRIQAEKEWHDSEDLQRNESQLIRGVYGSNLFAEAESHFLNALGDVQGLRILDFGCGTAHSSYQLQARQARVTGIDLSLPRIIEGKGWFSRPEKQNEPSFAIAAGEYLPFDEGTFDAVCGKQILHHVVLETAMPEIVRVLKTGGKAVFLEPLRHNPILEGYRRLTPHLRSPSERALSMTDLAEIGAYFKTWQHQEFVLLSALPVLLETGLRRRNALQSMTDRMRKVDRFLTQKIPAIGRYYWETVIILEK